MGIGGGGRSSRLELISSSSFLEVSAFLNASLAPDDEVASQDGTEAGEAEAEAEAVINERSIRLALSRGASFAEERHGLAPPPGASGESRDPIPRQSRDPIPRRLIPSPCLFRRIRHGRIPPAPPHDGRRRTDG